jgi:mRNA interferase MazF
MVGATPSRGQIWWAGVGLEENKRFVVVSNNVRNRQLNDVLGVRLTTSHKPDLPSIVAFPDGVAPGLARSYAVADDIWPLYKIDMTGPIGALTPAQMSAVESAMRVALDI